MPSKQKVFDLLLDHLHGELRAAVNASRDAADYATNEEAKAESKYDTQGLEASYLAAGQAAHAREFADSINKLLAEEAGLTASSPRGMAGALLHCSLGGVREWFYLCPCGGGEVLTVDDEQITVVTADSPLGHALLGKGEKDRFTLANGNQGEILKVI